MKLFLKTSLIFAAFLGLFYAVVLFYWKDIAPSKFKKNINYRIGSYGHMFTRINDIPNYTDVDILFLGSSHAYRGFDVREFEKAGYTGFNLGSSAQTPIQTEILLMRYLEELNPKMVIYEVYPGSFCNDGVESSVDLIANDQNDWHSFQMALKVNNIKVWNTLVLGLINNLFGVYSDFTEPVINRKSGDTYISGGFVEKEMVRYDGVSYGRNRWELINSQLKCFTRIVDRLESRGITLKLIYAPITKSLYRTYVNSSEFDDLMNGFGEYHNYNEIMPMDDALYFYDSHHLNQQGVTLFNKKVIIDMVKD